ncbi:hypothetical protein X474_12785 [Dethiosulfatarculus sandiegensis]|uniref:Uncharacterized protein n=1 Tax=Dethiosulfatarculus sandiegensis TaxID=1429043 RepID=A0A0D2JEC9_9BACT|nr:hypothetical protein X474_12785 [Dethiosulfatarculus sandiegensis]
MPGFSKPGKSSGRLCFSAISLFLKNRANTACLTLTQAGVNFPAETCLYFYFNNHPSPPRKNGPF